jgi:hypothetical protein
MVYSNQPPFEILQTHEVDFSTMVRLRHFARTWNLTGNSGNFADSLPMFWANGESPFQQLMSFTEFVVQREQRLHGISLVRLSEAVFDFLIGECEVSHQEAAEAVWKDYTRGGRSDRPAFLRGYELPVPTSQQPTVAQAIPTRQQRHVER